MGIGLGQLGVGLVDFLARDQIPLKQGVRTLVVERGEAEISLGVGEVSFGGGQTGFVGGRVDAGQNVPLFYVIIEIDQNLRE